MPIKLPLRERFWGKVDIRGPDECWPWMAGKCKGYGVFWFKKRMTRAHRVAFFLGAGSWPTGVARHSCDNKACCNYHHLLDGGQLDNVKDRVARGRSARGQSHGFAKLTNDDVRAIRAEYGRLTAQGKAPYGSVTRLGKKYGVGRGVVSRLYRRASWKHLL